MYADMEQWNDIRRRVLVDGVSKRSILRETGMHWRTLNKILTHSEPPGYQLTKPRERPKIGPFEDRIKQILEDDLKVHKKQRHTAKRIWERLRDENGYQGAYSTVREAVRRLTQKNQEVFIPLKHPPGEAQVDFGHALACVGGQLRKIPFFVMSLPHSDAVFVMAFERENTETFQEGHVQAFEFFNGVPKRITYDNTRIAVSQIIGSRQRRLTHGFLQLKSHYLFDHHFCLPARGNEKGVVEGLVKYTRLNFMVPVPQVRDFEELNAQLRQQCQEELKRRLRGKSDSKEVLLTEDQAAMIPLPASPFEAARKVSTTANSLSLVRFDCNDYSVPVCWAHHPIVAKGFCWEVFLYAQGQEVARHSRIWDKEKVKFEPVHYLALLERKPGALDHALPLDKWELPETFTTLRKRLENQYGGEGVREYIKILRLLEKHSMPALVRALSKALEYGAITRDAVAQFLYPQETWCEQTFNLDGHPHLKHVWVKAPDLSEYAQLVGGER
jgi:transposase